ncbi:MAG: hypothetical protein ACM3P1_04390 [Candidatus Saccharibacteria bacterium]
MTIEFSAVNGNAQGSKVDLNCLIIKSNGLGNLKTGMQVAEIFIMFPYEDIKKETINLEDDEYDVYNFYKNDKVIFSVEPNNEKIWRIWIHSERITTEKGLKIGDRLRDIKKYYKIKDFVVGEGQVAINVENYDYGFILESKEIPEGWWTNQKLETLNDNLKIESIIITGRGTI